MIKVKSSNIAAVDFDPNKGTLDIEFHTGKKYRYDKCTPELYQAFLEAPSQGKFFAEHIRGTLPFNPIELPLPPDIETEE